MTEPDGTHRTLSLEVPHFPPPFPACWMIAACGMLMTVWLVLTAVRVEEYRGKRTLPKHSGMLENASQKETFSPFSIDNPAQIR